MLDNVSRETLSVLEDLVLNLLKWTKKINLIGKASEEEVWRRHILDSVQLFYLSKQAERWVDLGSGGGFPALVIAILAREKDEQRMIFMVESDQRKCVFLQEMVHRFDLNAQVLNARIESVPPLKADVLSARALTNLSDLLGYTHMHRVVHGKSLFPKGMRHEEEIAEAKKKWCFEYRVHPSQTDSSGVILEIGEVSHA